MAVDLRSDRLLDLLPLLVVVVLPADPSLGCLPFAGELVELLLLRNLRRLAKVSHCLLQVGLQ